MGQLLDILSGVGNVLDVPSSIVRDILGGQNPGDQLLSPWSSDNRLSGRDLLRQYGFAGSDDTWGNFAGGLAAEIALDPMNIIGGTGLLKRLLQGSRAKKVLKASDYFTPGAPLKHGPVRPGVTPAGTELLDSLPLLPRKHPTLKMPMADAKKAASKSSWTEFAYGEPKAVPHEFPGTTVDAVRDVQPAWDEISARYPATTWDVQNVADLPEELLVNAAPSGAGYGPLTRTLYNRPGDQMTPSGMLHETAHAAQTKLARDYPRLAKRFGYELGDEGLVGDLRHIEAPAYRRETEALVAGELYGMLKANAQRNRLAQQLGAYNATVAPARMEQ